ncbi:uncharacterized protein LOC123015568 [Tribolium madens]|uniref:uncharacterized protein LOC123015568 n=1 Tax=Tribolium madens TaxID=41895 RepID=UPI001CF75CAD|nr:uncharacterized protein LOC123015568 [Tribolium madens]
MNIFLSVIILSLCILQLSFARSSIKWTLLKPHPSRKVGRCYNKKYGHLSVGRTDIKGECMALKCHPNGSITLFECGPRIFKGMRRCVREKPLEPWKPFRRCCPVHCPEMGNHYM